MQWHSQFTITIGLIAMLWITSAGVKDDQFEDGSWGRLKETLSHKHMCSWCAGQEDWSAAALNFSQQVFLLSTIITELHVLYLEERVVCSEQEILDRTEHGLLCRHGHDHLHPRPPGPQQEGGRQPGDDLHLHGPGHQPTPGQGRGLSPGEAGSLVPPGAI